MSNKLNVLLAKTDQLNAVIKKNITDAIATFKNKQAMFKGEKTIYKHRAAEFANPSANIDKPVASTVYEWLRYTFKGGEEFLKAKLDQEATNCSGTAKADLVVEGRNFGKLTTGELMALKGFFEQAALRDMFEAMPTISLTERWKDTENLEYKDREIKESTIQEWIDKETITSPSVVWDPAGKQPGVTINIKSTVEKADISRQLFSGEISHVERAAILERLTKTVVGIKAALEHANNAEVVPSTAKATDIFAYIVG